MLRALILLATLLLGGAAASFDGTIVRTYEVASPQFQVHLGDPFGLTADDSVDVGGFTIPGDLLTTALVDIAVDDAVSPHARALACQDLDLDAVCGEADAEEFRVEFCDTLADPANVLVTSGHAFAPFATMTVFVFASPVRLSLANPGTSGPAPCPGGALNAATTGTVTVRLDP